VGDHRAHGRRLHRRARPSAARRKARARPDEPGGLRRRPHHRERGPERDERRRCIAYRRDRVRGDSARDELRPGATRTGGAVLWETFPGGADAPAPGWQAHHGGAQSRARRGRRDRDGGAGTRDRGPRGRRRSGPGDRRLDQHHPEERRHASLASPLPAVPRAALTAEAVQRGGPSRHELGTIDRGERPLPVRG